MYSGLSLVICIVLRYFFIGTIWASFSIIQYFFILISAATLQEGYVHPTVGWLLRFPLLTMYSYKSNKNCPILILNIYTFLIENSWILQLYLISNCYCYFFQEWYCTFCWLVTLPSGMRTSTGCTPRSRPELMTTHPQSGILSRQR